MKVHELRLGNYIHAIDIEDNCIVAKVIAVSNELAPLNEHGDNVLFECENNSEGSMPFEGIKITHDWFVKFNFDLGWIIEHNTKFICLYQEGDSFYYSADMHHHTSAPIKYVHQLQNLFFALTGEELTIK